MDELDGLAMQIGETVCQSLVRSGHLGAFQTLCSDGSYSAGWKLLVAGLVPLGLAAAWAFLGRQRG